MGLGQPFSARPDGVAEACEPGRRPGDSEGLSFGDDLCPVILADLLGPVFLWFRRVGAEEVLRDPLPLSLWGALRFSGSVVFGGCAGAHPVSR